MSKTKRIMVLILSLSMLVAGMVNVSAMTEEKIKEDGSTRMYSTTIAMGMAFVDGDVAMDCSVSGPLSTKSITLLFILKEENEAGNLVMVDTWNDSGDGYRFDNEYEYSPAIEGREYELTVRVGIHDKDGLVGYDYETISATN